MTTTLSFIEYLHERQLWNTQESIRLASRGNRVGAQEARRRANGFARDIRRYKTA